jgi:hypothetical protein
LAKIRLALLPALPLPAPGATQTLAVPAGTTTTTPGATAPGTTISGATAGSAAAAAGAAGR